MARFVVEVIDGLNLTRQYAGQGSKARHQEHANASRHSAHSHGHIVKLQAQLQTQVQELLALVKAADASNTPDGMSFLKSFNCAKTGLQRWRKARIAARVQERYARKKAEFDEEMSHRQAKKMKRDG